MGFPGFLIQQLYEGAEGGIRGHWTPIQIMKAGRINEAYDPVTIHTDSIDVVAMIPVIMQTLD